MSVYLLHFDGPYGHARHYLGYANKGNVLKRLHHHLTGNGARLVQVAVEAGCTPYLVRIWPDATRNDERRLKAHSSTRLCPVCVEVPYTPRYLDSESRPCLNGISGSGASPAE